MPDRRDDEAVIGDDLAQRIRSFTSREYWDLCVERGASEEQVADMARRTFGEVDAALKVMADAYTDLYAEADQLRESDALLSLRLQNAETALAKFRAADYTGCPDTDGSIAAALASSAERDPESETA